MIAWQFKTKRYAVKLRIEPETLDPRDCFEFKEHIRDVREGRVEWFCAIVEVWHGRKLIGRDLLGACAYSDVHEFYTSHRDRDPMNRNSSIMRSARGDNVRICHYFPSMVREAINDARATLASFDRLRA